MVFFLSFTANLQGLSSVVQSVDCFVHTACVHAFRINADGASQDNEPRVGNSSKRASKFTAEAAGRNTPRIRKRE